MAQMQLNGVPPAPAGTGPAAAGGNALSVAPGPAAAPHTPVPATGAELPPAGAMAAVGALVAPKPPDKNQVKAAVADANKALAAISTQLVFVFDDQAHHLAVKLLDVQTQKVVQVIPTRAMTATASALSKPLVSGALVDTRA